MSRGNDPATQAELVGNHTRVALIKLGFAQEILLCSAMFDVPWSGDTYVRNNAIVRIGTVKESSALTVGTWKLQLSAADQTLLAVFLNNPYIGIPVEYRIAVLDAGLQVVGVPMLRFEGEIAGLEGADTSGKSEYTVSSTSQEGSFKTVTGRRTNPASQEALYPGDLFMSEAAVPLVDERWGR